MSIQSDDPHSTLGFAWHYVELAPSFVQTRALFQTLRASQEIWTIQCGHLRHEALRRVEACTNSREYAPYYRPGPFEGYEFKTQDEIEAARLSHKDFVRLQKTDLGFLDAEYPEVLRGCHIPRHGFSQPRTRLSFYGNMVRIGSLGHIYCDRVRNNTVHALNQVYVCKTLEHRWILILLLKTDVESTPPLLGDDVFHSFLKGTLSLTPADPSKPIRQF